MTILADSGQRHEYGTGAVREVSEENGRCDLLPLDVAAEMLQSSELQSISEFMETGKTDSLYEAVFCFAHDPYYGIENMLLESSKHFADGAKKYSEDNWKKGIPVSRYIDSAVRHYIKWSRNDKDESHDRAFIWNLLCAIWTCKHKPELNQYSRQN